MLAFLLIIIGIFGRMLPHDMNFTPVLAVALFSGVYLKGKWTYITPLALMLVTDIMIGFHSTMPVTWGAMALIVWIGTRLDGNVTVSRAFTGGLLAAVAFFLITNFGSWLALYERSWQELIECYIMAVPFFRNTLVSTLIYTGVLFGVYETARRTLTKPQYASFWLVK